MDTLSLKVKIIVIAKFFSNLNLLSEVQKITSSHHSSNQATATPPVARLELQAQKWFAPKFYTNLNGSLKTPLGGFKSDSEWPVSIVHCEFFQKYQLKMKLMFCFFCSYEQISVLVLKCDVSGTSNIHFSLVFSLVSCFNIINGLVLEVRGEDVILF